MGRGRPWSPSMAATPSPSTSSTSPPRSTRRLTAPRCSSRGAKNAANRGDAKKRARRRAKALRGGHREIERVRRRRRWPPKKRSARSRRRSAECPEALCSRSSRTKCFFFERSISGDAPPPKRSKSKPKQNPKGKDRAERASAKRSKSAPRTKGAVAVTAPPPKMEKLQNGRRRQKSLGTQREPKESRKPRRNGGCRLKKGEIDWSPSAPHDDHCALVANGCSFVHRMLLAVVKYSALSQRRDGDRRAFVRSISKYAAFYGDFEHILGRHNAADIEFIRIYKQRHFRQIRKCDATNCLMMALRAGNAPKCHFKEHAKGTATAKEALFVRDLMDAAHCYLVHGVDCGLRVQFGGAQRRRSSDGLRALQKWRGRRPNKFQFVTAIEEGSQPRRGVVALFCTPQCVMRGH